jgi:hypothetical protein
MPANPRRLVEPPLLDARRAPEVRRAVEARLLDLDELRRDADVRRPLERERDERERLDVECLEVVRLDFDRPDDFLPRWDLVSPFSRRILFTVRAATSSARPPYRPDFFALSLMCLYCRSRFGLEPAGIDLPP